MSTLPVARIIHFLFIRWPSRLPLFMPAAECRSSQITLLQTLLRLMSSSSQPKVSQGEAMLEWIRKATTNTDVTMSVCTGAFVLAKTGLLSGKAATTFHTAFNHFEMRFPDIHLKRGARFVEDGNLATAGGLTTMGLG